MHVMNDTADPFYTCMGSETCESSKPSGDPCSPAYNCSRSSSLSNGAKIAIAVAVPVACLAISSGIVYLFLLRRRRGKGPWVPVRDSKL